MRIHHHVKAKCQECEDSFFRLPNPVFMLNLPNKRLNKNIQLTGMTHR